MNFQELQTSEIKNIYLAKGDAFLCANVKKMLAQKLNVSSINISTFTDENYDTNNVLNACNQFSFFNEKRMVVVQDISKELSKPEKDRFDTYSNNVNKDCVLLIIDTIDAKVFDFLKNAEIIECKPTDYFLTNEIKSQFSKRGYTITPENCKKISDYCLNNLNRINLEVKKICDYLGQEKDVSAKTIDLLVFKDTELKVFDLTNALGVKDGNRALKILNDMLLSNEAPIKILGLITAQFRRMMFAKINKGTNAELAKTLGVKEFAITKAKESASGFSASSLKNIMYLLLETDYNIKSGEMSQENALYYLICKIVNM